jgi:TPR repeat protein
VSILLLSANINIINAITSGEINNKDFIEDQEVNFAKHKCNNLNEKNNCKNLADMYESLNDRSNSFKYRLKACEANDFQSCFKIGEMYRTGENIIKPLLIDIDKEKAKKFYYKSCSNEYKNGCVFLSGVLAFDSDSTTIEKIKGEVLLNKLCKSGLNFSCEQLKQNKSIYIEIEEKGIIKRYFYKVIKKYVEFFMFNDLK